MVFQNYALYPYMNVFQNMSFGLRLRKLRVQMRTEIKKIHQRVQTTVV